MRCTSQFELPTVLGHAHYRVNRLGCRLKRPFDLLSRYHLPIHRISRSDVRQRQRGRRELLRRNSRRLRIKSDRDQWSKSW